MIKLFNTLTRKVEPVKPQKPPLVTVYTCGPTVYDYAHIGNWYTFIRYDLLVRALKASGLKPKWIMNITDVGHLVSDADEGEDKLEKGARREGKTAWEVAAFYGDNFLAGLKKLNFLTPDGLPRATDHIAEQIALIDKLEAKGFTYQIADGIYFDTSHFAKYGDLAKLDLDAQAAGARVAVAAGKKQPADFALWKFSPHDKQRDMEWDSPWGKGFPGWHIECSAMSMKYLGETLDIHAGGIDHIPVHHTNEIAQSEAASGKLFSNYWLHTNFCLIDNQKMSKSLGNLFTLEDIEKKGYSAMAFRLVVLESHYQSQAHFSWEAMSAAASRLDGLYAMSEHRWQPHAKGLLKKDLVSYEKSLLDSLQDNLNSPKALATLSELASSVDTSGMSLDAVNSFTMLLDFIDSLLGLDLSARKDISASQKELLKQRQKARADQDWQSSDQLRDKLIAQGITVRDTSYGQVWHRQEI